jgi:hypothetical protein
MCGKEFNENIEYQDFCSDGCLLRHSVIVLQEFQRELLQIEMYETYNHNDL